jgi:hypothetical protein
MAEPPPGAMGWPTPPLGLNGAASHPLWGGRPPPVFPSSIFNFLIILILIFF